MAEPKTYPCGKTAYQEYIKQPVNMMIGEMDKKYEQLTRKIPNRLLREAANSHAGKAVAYMLGAGASMAGSVAIAGAFNDGTPVFGGLMAASAFTMGALHHTKNTKMARVFVHASQSAIKTAERDTREDRKRIAERISGFANSAVNKTGQKARKMLNSKNKFKQVAGLAMGSIALALKRGKSH